MIISVLERRSEIGLRRALGATKGHIRVQFLTEAVLLPVAGGAAGVGAGVMSTATYASSKHELVVIPTLTWAGGIGAALLIGAAAGLWPALRAARMSPTAALWSMQTHGPPKVPPPKLRLRPISAGRGASPQSFLTDNGLVFSTQKRHDLAGAVELELLALGIGAKHSRPYHPQTCGKVEHSHQTMKKYLANQEPAATKKQLQTQLDRFARYYNQMRPHRGVGRRTPAEVFAAREKAYPTGPRIDVAGYRVRRDKVDKGGGVTLRYQGRLHHIGVGRAYRGWRVILLVVGRQVEVIGAGDGCRLRRLTLEPTTDYQRMP